MALAINNANAILSISAPIPSYPFSIVAWLRVPNTISLTSLMGLSSTSTGARCDVYFAGDSTKEALVKTTIASGSGSAFSTIPMVPGKWHHLSAVFASDNERRIYVDGGNVGINNDNLPISDLDFFYLGNLFGFEFVDVAEFSVIRAAVSAEQAASFANGAPILASPYSGNVVTYHDCIRQTNHPGLGPKFIVVGSSPVIKHPPVLHAVGGYATAMPNRVRGPWHVERPIVRSLPVAKGQLSVAGVSSNDSILSGEVTV